MTHVFRKRGEVLRSFPRKMEFVGLVRACFEKALREIDGYTLSQWDVPIVFYAKGRTAGHAKWDKRAGKLIFNIEFNIDAIAKDWDHLTRETIPHEIAHIVDVFIHDGKSNHHNAVWKRYARRLGCKGDRCHSINTERARKKSTRKRRRIQYVTDCGTEIWLTMNIHNKIQRGQTRILKANRSKITASHCTGRVKVV